MSDISKIQFNSTLYDIVDEVGRSNILSPVISVTAPAGTTITATLDSTTITAVGTDPYVLTVPTTGEWTVHAVNGSDSNETVINIDGVRLFELEISFGPTASVNPKSGVTYTNGLSELDAATLSLYASAISNNSEIINTTSAVYIDVGGSNRKLSVGDTITWAVNGVNYVFVLIGFNHDDLSTPTAYGAATATGKAGITWQMQHCLNTTYQMNSSSTNNGGWASCALRTTLQSTIKNQLPSAVRSSIKTVKKKAAASFIDDNNVYDDTLFLLSEFEIFGSTTNAYLNEGNQYAYYKAGNSKIKHVNGSATNWWERSMKRNDSKNFCLVNNGNYGSGSASNSRGVAFGFCI